MTRLTQIPAEQWDPRIKAVVQPENLTDLEQGLTRYFAHTPELALGLMGFAGAMKMNRTLPERLLELVRLRIAFFNQCRSCMAIRYSDAVADGVDEDAVCSLEKPQEADNLTDAEKSAIRYGELLATNNLAIDDAVYADLKAHFSEAEIVELGMYAAFCVGFGRLAATYHMVDELPEAFRTQTQTLTPWGQDSVTVR
ncbi:MAG: carboxymuconolactone decarboxylase family protein [Sphingomonadales bacterium]